MNAVEAKNLWYSADIAHSDIIGLKKDSCPGNYSEGVVHLSEHNCTSKKEDFLATPCRCIYFNLETGEAKETAHLPYDPDSECAKWRKEEDKKKWRIVK